MGDDSLQRKWEDFRKDQWALTSSTLNLTDLLVKDLQSKRIITDPEFQRLRGIPESEKLTRASEFDSMINDARGMVPKLKNLVLCLKSHQCMTPALLLQDFAQGIGLDTSDWKLSLVQVENFLWDDILCSIPVNLQAQGPVPSQNLMNLQIYGLDLLGLQILEFCSFPTTSSIPMQLLVWIWSDKRDELLHNLETMESYQLLVKDMNPNSLNIHPTLQLRIRSKVLDSEKSAVRHLKQVFAKLSNLPLNQPEDREILQTYACLWSIVETLNSRLDNDEVAELTTDIFDFLSFRDKFHLGFDFGPALNVIRDPPVGQSLLVKLKLSLMVVKANVRAGNLDSHEEARKYIGEGLEDNESNSPVYAVIHAELFFVAGKISLAKNSHKNSEHCFKLGIGILHDLAETQRFFEAALYYGVRHAKSLMMLTRYSESQLAGEIVLNLNRKEPTNAVALWSMAKIKKYSAWVQMAQGHFEEALSSFNQLLTNGDHNFGFSRTVRMKHEFADMLVSVGSIADAVQLRRETLDETLKLGLRSPEVIKFKFFTADTLMLSGNLEDAVNLFKEVGNTSPITVPVSHRKFIEIAEFFVEECKNFKAGEFLSLDKNDTDINLPLQYKAAKQLLKRGKLSQAKSKLNEALRVSSAKFGAWATENFKIRNQLCLIHRDEANAAVGEAAQLLMELALKELVAMAAVRFTKLRAMDLDFHKYYHNLGIVLFCARDYPRALEIFQGLSVLRSLIHGKTNEKAIISRLWYGKTLMAMKKFGEATTVLAGVVEAAEERLVAEREMALYEDSSTRELETDLSFMSVDDLATESTPLNLDNRVTQEQLSKTRLLYIQAKWNLGAALFKMGRLVEAQRALHGIWMQLLSLLPRLNQVVF